MFGPRTPQDDDVVVKLLISRANLERLINRWVECRGIRLFTEANNTYNLAVTWPVCGEPQLEPIDLETFQDPFADDVIAKTERRSFTRKRAMRYRGA